MKQLFFATVEGLEIANHLAGLGFIEKEAKYLDIKAREENFNIIIDWENKLFYNVDAELLDYSTDLARLLGSEIKLTTLEHVKNWKL